jgi:hypothetical protein
VAFQKPSFLLIAILTVSACGSYKSSSTQSAPTSSETVASETVNGITQTETNAPAVQVPTLRAPTVRPPAVQTPTTPVAQRTPQTQAQPPSTATPVQSPTQSSTTSTPAGPFYIKGKEFFRRKDNSVFVPHGVNYVRLANFGAPTSWHSNFDATTYNRTRTITDLTNIKNAGYNVVRVFISHSGASGSPVDGSRLNKVYMQNLRDFLSLARERGLYINLTTAWLPESYYSKLEEYRLQNALVSRFEGVNAVILDLNFVKAFRDYWLDILSDVHLFRDVIFSVDISNEAYLDISQTPFSGGVSTVNYNSKSYNLTLNSGRQSLAQDATIGWANTVAQGIKNAYPDLLLTASIFSPAAVSRNPNDLMTVGTDSRHPLSLIDLAQTKIDYLDLHIYASSTPSQDLDSARLYNADSFVKPVVIGELGANRPRYPQLAQAATAFSALVEHTCRRGVSGLLFWTWNSSVEQPEFWDLTERSGAFNGLFSPTLGPVCSHHRVGTIIVSDGSLPVTSTPAVSDFHQIYRLYNSSTNSHTTSTQKTNGGYIWDQTSFILATSNMNEFNRPLYLCRQRLNALTFNSIDRGCEGHLLVSELGYLSSGRTEVATQAIFRCYKGSNGHFTTHTVRECDDNNFMREGILGYAPPR